MKKLRNILTMLLVAIFSCTMFVACDKDNDPPESPEAVIEQAIKNRFDEAYQMILNSENYVQDVTYRKYEGGYQVEWDTSHLIPKMVTNISGNTTKIYIEKGNGGYDCCYVLTLTDANLIATLYDVDDKTYWTENQLIDQVILEYGSVEYFLCQIKHNMHGADVNYNLFFEKMLEQLKSENATGAYSKKIQEGYEYLTYTITTNTKKLEYTVSIKNNQVVSFREKTENLSDGSYTIQINNFRYSGEDLMIDLNHGEYTEK